MRNLFVLSLVLSLIHPSISRSTPRGLAQVPLLPTRVEEGLGDGDEGVWRLDLADLTPRERMNVRRLVEDAQMDIWRHTHTTIDLRADHPAWNALAPLLPSNVNTTLWLPHLSSLIGDTLSSLSRSSPGIEEEYPTNTIESHFHDSYHTLEEIHAFGDSLISAFSGRDGVFVERFTAGTTFEGREIVGWRASMASPPSSDVASSLSEKEEEDEEELESDAQVETAGKRRKGPKGPKKPKVPGPGGGSGRKKDNSTELVTREIVIQSGQHAREWVGPSTAMYFLHSLLLSVTSEPYGEAATLLRHYTFTIIPTINPDGLVYSQGGKTQRLWRKNRQPTTGENCGGIDLNSNWGYEWRPVGSPSPCSDSYPGTSAFEAYETRAMANYLANGTTYGSGEAPRRDRRVRSFVDLHSYGQLFMFPFAHSCDDFPSDAETLMEAGLGVSKAMRTVHGEAYQSGQACDLTYRAPGDAIDYAYGVTDIRFSYSAELRDTGTYGFLLPPSLIRPAAEETTAGLMYLAKFIYNLEIIN